VHALRRLLHPDELLTGFGLAQQRDRPPQEPSLPGLAILLDQLIDTGTPFGRFFSIDFHHTISMTRALPAHCPQLHSVGRVRAAVD